MANIQTTPGSASLTPNFDAVQLQLPDAQDPTLNPNSSQNGLSFKQRFIVKNLFDTQIEKRKEYLKQLGYEMEKGGEGYRPLGSDADFIPIEEDNTTEGGPTQAAAGALAGGAAGAGLAGPLGAVGGAVIGGALAGAGLVPKYNLATPNGWLEMGRDITDVGFDTLVSGPAIATGSEIGMGAGSTAGTTAGGAVGGAIAGPPGALAGAAAAGGTGAVAGSIAGGAAGNAGAEAFKAAMGGMVLDKSIPMDLRETTYQSLVSGVLQGGARSFGAALNKWRNFNAKQAQEALKEAAIRKSGGLFNEELASDLIQNPERYTQEAVSGARKQLLKFQQEIFGTSATNPKSTRELTGGVAKEAIGPLNDQADLEIQRLAHDKAANTSAEDLIQLIKDRAQPIRDKTFKSQDDKRALAFFSDQIEEIKNKLRVSPEDAPVSLDEYGREIAAIPGEEKFREANFKEGRDIVKNLQNAYYEEGPVKGNATVRDLMGGAKELFDAKAGDLGSPLPEINGKRSKILSTYKNMRAVLTPQMLDSAFIGNDRTAKLASQEVLNEADSVLGTKLSEGLQRAQYRAAVESFYNNPRAFGSGSVLGEAMSEGLRQARGSALKGLTVGSVGGGAPGAAAGAKVGGAVGFVKGFKEGSLLASPKTLISNASKIKTRISDLNKDPTRVQATLSRFMQPGAIAGTQLDAGTAPLVADRLPAPVSGAIDAGVGAVESAMAPGPAPVTEPPDISTPNFDALELKLPPADEKP